MLTTIEVTVNRIELTEDGQVRVWCRPVTPEGDMSYPEHPPFSVPAGTEPGLGTRITITYALKEGA